MSVMDRIMEGMARQMDDDGDGMVVIKAEEAAVLIAWCREMDAALRRVERIVVDNFPKRE